LKKHLHVISFFLIVFFVGCFSGTKLERQNIADLYLPQNQLKQNSVDYRIDNDAENISLFFELKPLNVVKKTSNFDVKLNLSLYNNSKTNLPVREIVQLIEFSNLKAEYTFNTIDSYDLISYNLESDNLTKTLTGFIQVDELNKDDLSFIKNDNANKSYYKKNDRLSFNAENVLIKYFDIENNIALPPYITDIDRLIKQPELTASTTLTEATFTLPQIGYYLFESKEKQKGILCVDDNFPALNNYQTYVLSLRYITKNEELKQLLSYKNLEEAIDSFWLDIGNNIARANKLKEEYLLRLTTSNQYFSSLKPGWQTDRGMIYTIFGPPNEVYKTEEGENWYFKEPQAQFKFIKKVIMKNYNHYQLQRNENLALYWHQAVNKWRNGHIKSTEVLE